MKNIINSGQFKKGHKNSEEIRKKIRKSQLLEGLKLIGSPAHIPDCSRTDLPQFFVDQGYKAGAEIGVYKGGFTKRFCEAGLKMFAVDPWTAYYGDRDQGRVDSIYEEACKTLSPYSNCTIIKKSSMEATGDIPNLSLDFVYIDSDHRFKQTAEDIVEWSKKVRSGGVVAGHDYFTSLPWARKFRCQVKAVVDAYAKAFGYDNFYTLGDLDHITEPEWMQWTLSWFWIKK